MTFRKKTWLLVSLIIILASVYALSFALNTKRVSAGNFSFAWIDKNLSERINRISFNTLQSGFELLLKDKIWYILIDGNEYPARKARIEDFIGIFTDVSAWPLRSSGDSVFERFGLDEFSASRIVFYDNNYVLLDLLFGNDESSGTGIYLRKAAGNEVRSGDYGIKTFLYGYTESWFNLRLIPESESGLGLDDVQRVSVFSSKANYVFSRSARSWIVTGAEIENPDISLIERYILELLNTEGGSFLDACLYDDSMFNFGSILLELGDGSIINIRFTPGDENANSIARRDSSGYVYSIPAWVFSRLFRDAQSFGIN